MDTNSEKTVHVVQKSTPYGRITIEEERMSGAHAEKTINSVLTMNNRRCQM